MAMSEKDYTDASYKLLPKGLAWRNMLSGAFGGLLSSLSKMWSQIDYDANQSLNEMNPQWATDMLTEWENLLGLPECSHKNQTLLERQNAAGYKWHLKGSLSPYFYKAWMKQAFNYDVEFVTYHPHHCLRGCDYPLYSDDYDSRAVVHVLIKARSPYRYFNIQDTVDMPLIIGHPSVAECLLRKYKPAHMELVFHYETGEE